MSEFKGFPKIPRLKRSMIVSEKLDGTNAAVIVAPVGDAPFEVEPIAVGDTGEALFALWAQSRKRLIFPGKQTDNYGFAGWVSENANKLATLGPGHHYGEWFGGGIQRGYGLAGDDKRFALFNGARYQEQLEGGSLPENTRAVPILFEGAFDVGAVDNAMQMLALGGSAAVEGYMDPEGVVVFHTAAKQVFKVTFEQDEVPKELRS